MPEPPVPAPPAPDPSGSSQPLVPSKVVAVVVTHNRLSQLRQTLARLLAVPAAHLSAVVVVDTASGDGTAQWLAAQDDPRLTVHRCAENLGGAGGFAMGMTLAQRFAPDWLLLMDDDARPAPDMLARFHAAPREAAEVWACAVTHPDGRICEMNRPWRNPFAGLRRLAQLARRGRDGFHLGAADYAGAQIQKIDVASFVGLFVAGRAVRAHGLPDARLFIYGDDALYCLRLGQAGCVLRFDPALHFEHDCASRDPKGALRPLWKVYYFHRNQVLLLRAAAGPWVWPALVLRALLWWAQAGRYGPQAGRYLRLSGRALWHGLRRHLAVDHAQVVLWAAEPARENLSHAKDPPA